MFLLSDGFDHYAAKTAQATAITNYLTLADYTVRNATNNTFNIVDGMDVGSLGLKMTINQGSATPPSLSRTIRSDADLVVFGFAFRGSGSRMRIARIDNVVDIDWDPVTGKLKIGSDLGANVIIMNAWWYFEIELDKTNEEIRVWANDTLQLTVALPLGVTDEITITWGMTSTSSSTGTIELDDFYVVDSSPGVNTERLGPVAITTRMPTADVLTEWSLVGTSDPAHYKVAAQLDPAAPNAPYLQANVEGKKDLFTSNVVLPNANEVYAVSVVTFARKGDLDDRSVGLIVKNAGGEVELPQELSETNRFYQAVFEEAPGGAAWTQNTVESVQFGIAAR